MNVDRRGFLGGLAFTVAALKGGGEVPAMPAAGDGVSSAAGAGGAKAKAYGSGYFGEWIEDEFGLPAFHYTCNQISDPKGATKVKPGILASTEHIHQLGNDRIVAIASNYGHIRVHQDGHFGDVGGGRGPDAVMAGDDLKASFVLRAKWKAFQALVAGDGLGEPLEHGLGH